MTDPTPQQRYNAQTLMELGQRALQLAAHPETRTEFLKMQKKVQPGYRLPVDVEIADLRKELAEEKEKNKLESAGEKVARRQEEQRAALLGKYTPEEVKEIEDTVMTKYGLSDYDAASKIYGADHKPAKANINPLTSGATWSLPELPGLLEDPVKAAREAAVSVIDELNRGKR